jgi:hypothetical protein
MNMKKAAAISVAVLSLALTWAPSASALPFMTGGFSIANTSESGFEWLCPSGVDEGANCPVATATLLDFQAVASTKSPGVPGVFLVNSASGSFAALLGDEGTIRDFNYVDAVGSGNFPAPPVLAFEVAPGVTVDLLSIINFTTICASGCDVSNGAGNLNSTLIINGTIVFHQAGFGHSGLLRFPGRSGQWQLLLRRTELGGGAGSGADQRVAARPGSDRARGGSPAEEVAALST